MNQTANFDVFLSHNGKEQRAAIAIGDRLRNWGLRVWLDAWELRPGLSWQEGILEGLASSAACAVLIGQSGYGGWHKREMEAALLRQGSEYPVIPVLLPGAPNRTDVGAFLSLLTWVDFRLGIDDTEALDRLIWGITGLRPNEAKGAVESEVRSLHSAVKAEGPSAPRYPSRGSRHPFKTGNWYWDCARILSRICAGNRRAKAAANSRFQITNPQNGDLLNGSSVVSGTGPPKERVFLHYRSPDRERFYEMASSETDEKGLWALRCPDWRHEGPYELYAAGVQDRAPSHPVTIFYRDNSNVANVARRISRHISMVEISYELHAAFIEGTKLKKGRSISSGRLHGPVENIERIATDIGEAVATNLRNLATRDELEVRVTIDSSGKIHFEPETAWASYYAFPVAEGDPRRFGFPPPSSDLPSLMYMRGTQMAWRLMPRGGQIPSKPFGDAFEAKSTYLEVRHEGYRPEFIPLTGTEAKTYSICLFPVLHKRIAVLDFPSLDSELHVAGFSQLIAREVVSAIERRPQLASFAYFRDSQPAEEGRMDFFEERLGRPTIEIGNEVLRLNDVQDVQKQLESVDTGMVSGEGRHLQRKALDIQFLVHGAYRLFKNTSG